MTADVVCPTSRQVVVAGLVCLCACLLVSGSVAAAAERPARVTAGSTYLALGDSVTFGYLEPTVVPAPDYARESSFLGFPEHLAARLRLEVTNAACPGETTASFLDASAQSYGCRNTVPGSMSGFYRPANPLHVRYSESQMAFAVRFLRRHRETRLVSLMLGANDFFVCQETTADRCASRAEQRATFSTVRDNVRTILTTIRRKARYRGQLAIVHYHSLDYSSPALNALSAGLNRAMTDGARPFAVRTADGYAELEAATRLFGGHTCLAGLVTTLGAPGTCGVHPTYAGQALLAQALEKVIRLR
jgi:lysophospholipase L1-like esterase